MDFILTNVFMFAIGVLVGRLFYKLNPFFMLFGIFIGGAGFVTALELNSFYCITLLFGIVYGLKIMSSRSTEMSDGVGGGSFFSMVSDFFYSQKLRRQARRFRQAEEEQDNAFDWFSK